MDAAERHIRVGGYDAFSFRDLAAEVGVKSSSVHYHFPTKEKLAAEVIHRYTTRVAEFVDGLFESQPDPVKVMTKAFGTPVHSSERLCPCVVLGAAIFDLPAEVSAEVRGYYRMWFDKLAARGLPEAKASVIMSTLLGAQMLAAVFDDVNRYDDAAQDVLREHAAAA
jgi:TetR/AcrR family transcriptional repressor of nem operon